MPGCVIKGMQLGLGLGLARKVGPHGCLAGALPRMLCMLPRETAVRPLQGGCCARWLATVARLLLMRLHTSLAVSTRLQASCWLTEHWLASPLLSVQGWQQVWYADGRSAPARAWWGVEGLCVGILTLLFILLTVYTKQVGSKAALLCRSRRMCFLCTFAALEWEHTQILQLRPGLLLMLHAQKGAPLPAALECRTAGLAPGSSAPCCPQQPRRAAAGARGLPRYTSRGGR